MKEFKNLLGYSKEMRKGKGKKSLGDFETDSEYSDSTDCNTVSKKLRHSRKRKTLDQLEVLEKEFHTCEAWDRKKVQDLANNLGLTTLQVYKWRWDFKKRLRKNNTDTDILPLLASESLCPSFLDTKLYNIQTQYKLFTSNSGLLSPSVFLASTN